MGLGFLLSFGLRLARRRGGRGGPLGEWRRRGRVWCAAGAGAELRGPLTIFWVTIEDSEMRIKAKEEVFQYVSRHSLQLLKELELDDPFWWKEF